MFRTTNEERDEQIELAPRLAGAESQVRFLCFVSLLSIVFASPTAARPSEESELDAQDVWAVYLDDLHPSDRDDGVLEIQFRALTEFGEPVQRLTPDDVTLLQDGAPLTNGLVLQSLEGTERGVTAVLVLDVSPTMQEVFDASRSAALDLFDRLGAKDQFAILSFAGQTRVIAPFGMDRASAREQLAGLAIDPDTSPTRLFDAIHEGLQLIRSGENLPRRSMLIVLSDGIDGGTSGHDIDQIVAASTGNVRDPSILVYAIGYRRLGGSGLGNLRAIASRTGGDYMEDLTRSYQDIWDQSEWSHLLRVRTPMDGRKHELTLKINGRAASRSAVYPGSPFAPWHYVAATGVVLLIVAFAWLRSRAGRHLTIQTGNDAGRRYRLRNGTTEIGRAKGNDIVIESINVSSRHVELTIAGGKAQLRDRGSTNGTFVNGVELKTTCALYPGDEIRLGDVELIFG